MGTRYQLSKNFRRRYRRGEAVSPLVAKAVESPVMLERSRGRPKITSLFVKWIGKPLFMIGKQLFIFLEVFALLIVLPTAYVLFVDLEDRQAQRIAQAWQIITQHAPGNSGKIRALEYLNKEDCEPSKHPKLWDIIRVNTTCWLNTKFMSLKEQIPLTGINLSEDAHSSSVYLRGVNLTKANLVSADLSKVDLSDAILVGANLQDAKLTEANLKGIDLSHADLTNANFECADLSSDSILRDAVLIGSNMQGAILNKSDLSNAHLDGAYLRNSKLSRAKLSGANLSGADLSGVELRRAKLTNIAFSREYQLRNSSMSGRVFENTEMSEAHLNGANLSGADLSKSTGLKQRALDFACGDEETTLPIGFTIKNCPEDWKRKGAGAGNQEITIKDCPKSG